MRLTLNFAAAAVLGAAVMVLAPAHPRAEGNAERKVVRSAEMTTTAARKHSSRRRGTRVYGYLANRRIGGYSYTYSDVTNTYGLSRSLYGSMNSWRDPSLDRQTRSGPFDHDFFFDSGVGPRGGESPYLH
ncbi:MAG: hypothetical protein NW223_15715 [Hyphomicrobiaceae bacterium]|nr:hypothetical protein [Hyphomicrobiaceae bacterium]